jgi:hypothetical protein
MVLFFWEKTGMERIRDNARRTGDNLDCMSIKVEVMTDNREINRRDTESRMLSNLSKNHKNRADIYMGSFRFAKTIPVGWISMFTFSGLKFQVLN